jgi:hypothetical protein
LSRAGNDEVAVQRRRQPIPGGTDHDLCALGELGPVVRTIGKESSLGGEVRGGPSMTDPLGPSGSTGPESRWRRSLYLSKVIGHIE